MLANSLSLQGMDTLPASVTRGMLVFLNAKYLTFEPGIYIYDETWKSVNQISILTGELRVLVPQQDGSTITTTLNPQELAYLSGLSSGLQAQLDAKTTKTYVDSALALKADITSLTSALALKVDSSVMQQAISSKVDTVTMNSALSSKVEQSAMTDALALKADKIMVTQGLATKANVSDMTTALAVKADNSAVNSALSTKVETQTYTDGLALKADKSALTTALASKVDLSTYNVDMPKKANISDVNASLALKADRTYVDSFNSNTSMTFFWPGSIGISSVGGLRWVPPAKIQILAVQAWVGAAGTLQGSCIFDVRKNGTSIFASLTDRPTISGTLSVVSQRTVLTATVVVDITDYITVHVISAAGSDGSLRIDFKPA